MSRPLRTILAATDLGPASDEVVRSAATLAHLAGAELQLIHSLDLPWTSSGDVMRRTGMADWMAAAEERLEEQVERTMPKGVRPSGRVVSFHAAHQAVLERAGELGADLIVVGPHSGGEVGAHFLGTTADRVLRTAEVPCLVARGAMEGGIRRIGVSLDLSEPARAALDAALSLAMQLAEGEAAPPRLHVMHVGWSVEREDHPDREERVIRPELEAQVDGACAEQPGAQAVPVGIEVLWANEPVRCIVAWATKHEMDLLVLGTQGLTGLRRMLLGSVASRVARRAPCPVLLVPPAVAEADGTAGRAQA